MSTTTSRTATGASEQTFSEVDAELAAAQAEEADLSRRYAEAIAALEHAIATSDVATVMRLRGDTEVALPQQLGVARTRLLAAQVAQAEEARAREWRLLSLREGEVDAAREARNEAERRLKEAWGAFHDAVSAETFAQRNVGWAADRLQKVRDEYAAHVASHEQDQQRRVRRMAGLPDSPAAAS